MHHSAPPTEGVNTPPEDVPLFAGYEPPSREPEPDLSPDQRRTKRQADLIAIARHWLPTPGVGADQPMARLYRRVTHGAGSDVRAWWPACQDYSPGDSISDDAARFIPGGDA